jgi:acyl carrier protein
MIMRGQPHPDNNQIEIVKAATYSVRRAARYDQPWFFRETSTVDPQVKEGVSERLISLARAVLGAGSVIPSPFPLDAQLSDLGISSLKLVNLMLAVEVEFDIAIAQADITPENFHSLQTIEKLVDRTLGRRA